MHDKVTQAIHHHKIIAIIRGVASAKIEPLVKYEKWRP